MSKATDIWFPVYIGDYTSATMHLTTEQHGAYFLLLMAAWKSDGVLPDDDDQLAAICRLPGDKWEKTRRVISGFFVIGNGSWSQKRLLVELEKAKARKNVSSANGSHGGRPKKPGRLPVGNPDNNPDNNLQESSSTFNLQPSPSTANTPLPPKGAASAWAEFRPVVEFLFGPMGHIQEQKSFRRIGELIAMNATPAELRTRADHYRKCWPDVAFTLQAVVNNWAVIPTLKPPKAEKVTPRTQVDFV